MWETMKTNDPESPVRKEQTGSPDEAAGKTDEKTNHPDQPEEELKQSPEGETDTETEGPDRDPASGAPEAQQPPEDDPGEDQDPAAVPGPDPAEAEAEKTAVPQEPDGKEEPVDQGETPESANEAAEAVPDQPEAVEPGEPGDEGAGEQPESAVAEAEPLSEGRGETESPAPEAAETEDERDQEAGEQPAAEKDEEESLKPEPAVAADEAAETGEAEEEAQDKPAESGEEGDDQEEGDEQEEGEEEVEEDEEEGEEDDEEEDRDKYEGITVEPVDYSHHTKDELIEILKILLETKPVDEIRDDVESIKVNFYKKHRAEVDHLRKKFLESGSPIEDFSPAPDPREDELKNLYKRYRSLRSAYNKQLEVQKEENLKKKYEVIAEIESLINREESINRTFQEFRDLQNRWREIGPVPQQHVKDLWDNYHYQVEKFYDYIKINKELRDLDLRKNLESKIVLCEKAEELLLESNVVKAFRELQVLHDQWREIGPVPHENKEEIWERFRAATTEINKRHQDHFVSLKENQRKNLEAKEELCNKVETILEQEFRSPRDWEQRSREIVEIQKIWKTIGYAPKKHNTRIYKRFREACDAFFKQKRAFYSEHKEEQKNNLQMKLDLCVQAEALQESTDWRKTTELLIELQKKWKEVGPVPRKHADQIWKRFRAACDHFFENKSRHFANKEEDFARNLEAKEKLLAEIEGFKPGEDVKAAFEQIKEYQKNWSEIGFVPVEKKDDIQNRYRNAINRLFDKLKMDDNKKNILKYRNRLDGMKGNEKADYKLQQDRDKFINKIKQLENDIVLWENNIGFFAKSKNAEAMIRDVQSRIDQAKKEIGILEEKVRLIDNFEPEEED